MGESTWEAFATHSRTNGGRRGERVKSTVGERCRVGEDGRMRKGVERVMAVVFPVGTRGKSGQDAGNSWILSPSMPSLNSKKMDDEPVGIEEAGGVRAGGDEISAYEGFRA